MFAIGSAKITATAIVEGIEADVVAKFDVGDRWAHGHYRPGAVAADDTRKENLCADFAGADSNVEAIDCRCPQFNDDVSRRFQLGIVGLLITQFVDAAMGVNLNSLQENVLDETSIALAR